MGRQMAELKAAHLGERKGPTTAKQMADQLVAMWAGSKAGPMVSPRVVYWAEWKAVAKEAKSVDTTVWKTVARWGESKVDNWACSKVVRWDNWKAGMTVLVTAECSVQWTVVLRADLRAVMRVGDLVHPKAVWWAGLMAGMMVSQMVAYSAASMAGLWASSMVVHWEDSAADKTV